MRLFEEFRGVLGAPAAGPLTEADYQALGVRQSLFAAGEARAAVHELFEKYVAWLKEAKLFDLNLVSHGWRAKTEPRYDFVVVDEVQDFTNAQLALIFDSLKAKDHFLLCGDAHQIVHPNFFSWASVRALFRRHRRRDRRGAAAARDISVLQANFRNTRAVTGASQPSVEDQAGAFRLGRSREQFPRQMRLCRGGRGAIAQGRGQGAEGARRIVARLGPLRGDRPARRGQGGRPRPFQDAARSSPSTRRKASNIRTSSCSTSSPATARVYAEVCRDVAPRDLEGDELDYRRARDKADKSLELNKFYVNALYVAMTRAIEGLTIVESDVGTRCCGCSNSRRSRDIAPAPVQASSKDEWAQEARKLELQGKQEQARAIRETFLAARPTPWTPWSLARLAGMGAQGARSQKPFRQDQTDHVRLCAVARTRRLYREARRKPISRRRLR